MRRRAGARPGPAGQVRIIAGQWRRRRLPVPTGEALRPTPDRVRETLFNWLGPRLEGARCLDLFAGSGALGFEAASRGAGAVVLVEQDPAVAALLEQNRALLGADTVEVVRAEALAWLASAAGTFDLVFLDPPFDGPLLEESVKLLHQRGLLAAGGRVYLESARPDFPLPAGWSLTRQGRAGQVHFALAEPTT